MPDDFSNATSERIGMKVLIVDDHPGVRTLIREMVTVIASDVRECADGAEAVRTFPEFAPDVVIMDLQMPRLDGFEATRQILAESPRARVIAISQLKHPHTATWAREAGACHFIQKDNLSELVPYLKMQAALGPDQI